LYTLPICGLYARETVGCDGNDRDDVEDDLDDTADTAGDTLNDACDDSTDDNCQRQSESAGYGLKAQPRGAQG
jgi:hypothetical protein